MRSINLWLQNLVCGLAFRGLKALAEVEANRAREFLMFLAVRDDCDCGQVALTLRLNGTLPGLERA